MLNDLISVVIPAYNAENTIKKCLDSIINQTYSMLQIMIVNDGSTDKTEMICNDYMKIDDRIIVINKENEGPGKAREEGLKKSNGKYISFIDSDDYIDNNFFSEMLDAFNKTNCDIVQCGYNTVDINGNIICKSKVKSAEINGNYNNAKEYAKQKKIDNFLWDKVFKKELFKNIQFLNLYASEDACILIQVFSKVNKSVIIDKNIYFYVQTQNSLCRKEFSLKRLDTVVAGEYMYKYEKEKYQDLADYFKLYICSHAGQCYCNLYNSNISIEKEYLKDMRQEFNNYFSFFNNKIFKVSFKRRNFIFAFKIFPDICAKILGGKNKK